MTDTEIVQLLHFDDNDEEGLLEANDEDLDFHEGEYQQNDKEQKIVEFLDEQTPERVV